LMRSLNTSDLLLRGQCFDLIAKPWHNIWTGKRTKIFCKTIRQSHGCCTISRLDWEDADQSSNGQSNQWNEISTLANPIEIGHCLNSSSVTGHDNLSSLCRLSLTIVEACPVVRCPVSREELSWCLCFAAIGSWRIRDQSASQEIILSCLCANHPHICLDSNRVEIFSILITRNSSLTFQFRSALDNPWFTPQNLSLSEVPSSIIRT
jgi:hypothetical protein